MDLTPAYKLLAILNAKVEAVKARDTREPLRKEKAALEEKIARMFERQFRAIGKRVSAWAENQPRVKVSIDIPEWLLAWDEGFEDDLIRVIASAVLVSGDYWFETMPIQFDTSAFNVRAYRTARELALDLIKGIDEVTKTTVRDAVQTFVSTPGFTIGDLADMLSGTFGESRAMTIAVTETTRTFAEGERQAGLELKEKYPDVPVVKTWFTNVDERVCEICGGLDGQEVEIEESFEFEGVEYPEPPAHPNCRCWMGTRTKIND